MINFNNYKDRYVSFDDSLMDELYKPMISESVIYERMSGYFSSNFIDSLYEEIGSSNISNNFKMKIICSPELSDDDKTRIKEGYELRRIIEENIIASIYEIETNEKKFAHITELIAKGIIDFRFVTTSVGDGIFHAKEGIFIDELNAKVAFIGSNNETGAAIFKNFETSLLIKGDRYENIKVIEDMENTFNDIWQDQNPNIIQCELTANITKAFKDVKDRMRRKNKGNLRISIVDKFSLYDYQIEAINKWKNNNYSGLLEMATGTGKTITAIACQEALQKHSDDLVTFIVAPQIDLIEQWHEELTALNISAIKCSSAEGNYRDMLKVKLKKRSTMSEPVVILVTSNTFSMKSFQKLIELHLKKEALLICDEVHSFGAEKMRGLYEELQKKFKYRLGISATPYRKDEDESELLIEFFNKIVFSYTLKDAIDNGFLNQYNYVPIILSFNKNELSQYRQVLLKTLKESKSKLNILKEIEKLTTSIANANIEKVSKLIELLSDENAIKQPKIIYCSPGNYNDGSNVHDLRHIDFVSQQLGNIGCKLRKIYSEIPNVERIEILRQFKNHEIDTLLAIKCLDQGVNLKEVTHAYILSSTDSMTEFIQRRGRILRKAPGKPISYIYDLVMLPESLEDLYFNPVSEDAYLVDRELRRMKEFNFAAENKNQNDLIINEIEEVYRHVLEELNNEPYN